MLLVATVGGGIYAFNAGGTTSGGGTNAGKIIRSRNQTPSSGGVTNQTNYFWADDCTASGGLFATTTRGTSGSTGTNTDLGAAARLTTPAECPMLSSAPGMARSSSINPTG
jgi:hypothetical protein